MARNVRAASTSLRLRMELKSLGAPALPLWLSSCTSIVPRPKSTSTPNMAVKATAEAYFPYISAPRERTMEIVTMKRRPLAITSPAMSQKVFLNKICLVLVFVSSKFLILCITIGRIITHMGLQL